MTLLSLYVARNFGKLVGLECPEPLANLYTRSYFRATWITTALDAGFWSAMRVRRKWLRDVLSMVFSVYYLICAEQADEKVRKIRATLTVDHLRVSWEKPTTPYLAGITNLMRPRFMRYPPRAIRIPRPQESSYKEPVNGWLYFNGPISAMKRFNRLVLDIPGGGFVAMNPRTHDDKLLAWAGKSGLPVLSLDYKKAPEYPYPYALNECYDVYHSIVGTNGRCIGFSGDAVPKIIVSGDSAGGNLATGLVLMILQTAGTETRRWQGQAALPFPEALILIYPALDMNIGNWMTDEQMALIRDRRMRNTNESVLRRKSEDYKKLTPSTPHHSDIEEDDEETTPPNRSKSQQVLADALSESPTAIRLPAAHTTAPGPPEAASTSTAASITSLQDGKPRVLKTRLAVSSMISYFNDRILTPEMMRAMIILYVGPHNRPDFSTDFLLSPLLAPEGLLAKMPKVYFLTGERDPLVDDTVIFAGRIRQAKAAAHRDRRELGIIGRGEEFRESDHVEVVLVPGISHGFLQFVSVFPEGWKYIFRCARWMRETFERVEREDFEEDTELSKIEETDYASSNGHVANGKGMANGNTSSDATTPKATASKAANGSLRPAASSSRHHRRFKTGESSADDDFPLEMTVARGHHSSSRGRTRGAPPRRPNPRREKSLVSLASEDDLLGRRMKGLTGSLLGEGIDD